MVAVMDYLYLVLAIVASCATNVFAGSFNAKQKKDASSLYNLILIGVALLSWGIVYVIEGGFEWGVVAYSAAFGLGFAMAMIGVLLATKYL